MIEMLRAQLLLADQRQYRFGMPMQILKALML
jgi:hypothetical protein